ncbi:hypothetical protein [Streptantibioticus ferralitis]|uniref:Secreted protein n=1 Tax=Streptantibioticus ferralitis TaxID=236510 RepID=A0ABT5ZEU8_9ACTN|nr:hypothetical protein [Streptantibioticus ferralitis]MDF2261555.1 hypothetical protein [Streptantibioticus ferralitis]
MTESPSRRLRYVIGAIVAAACLGLVATGWLAWDHSHIHDADIPGDVLLSSDGRSLSTPVAWTGCEDRPRFVAHETAHEVALVLERKRHAFLPKNTVCNGGDDALVTTALSHPLGSRKLTDAITGKSITPFPGANLLRPGYFPKGYVLVNKALLTDSSGPPYHKTRTLTWDSTYQRDTNKAEDPEAIAIIQTIGRSADVPGSPVSINGYSGRLQDGPLPAATWFDGTYTISVRGGDSRIATSELLKIAKYLHR